MWKREQHIVVFFRALPDPKDIPSVTLSELPQTVTVTLSHLHSQLDSCILPNQGDSCIIIQFILSTLGDAVRQILIHCLASLKNALPCKG